MKHFLFALAVIFAAVPAASPAFAQTKPAPAGVSSSPVVSTPVYVTPPAPHAAAPQTPAAQPAPQTPPVALTDAQQIKDADFIHDQLMAFSNYMNTCMTNNRGYRLMAECLCNDRTDFMHLYMGMDGLLTKYPAWQAKTVTYKEPDGDDEVDFDLGLWANRLTRFHANVCKGSG